MLYCYQYAVLLHTQTEGSGTIVELKVPAQRNSVHNATSVTMSYIHVAAFSHQNIVSYMYVHVGVYIYTVKSGF